MCVRSATGEIINEIREMHAISAILGNCLYDQRLKEGNICGRIRDTFEDELFLLVCVCVRAYCWNFKRDEMKNIYIVITLWWLCYALPKL